MPRNNEVYGSSYLEHHLKELDIKTAKLLGVKSTNEPLIYSL